MDHLTDEQLTEISPALSELVTGLEDVAENARYASDPRSGSAQIAAALAKYFRTPDAI